MTKNCSETLPLKMQPEKRSDEGGIKREEGVNTVFSIISTKRGADLLMYKGYRYTKMRRKKNEHVVWRCVNKHICCACVVTQDTLVINENIHRCQPDAADDEIRKRITECLHRVQNESTPFRQIYAEAVNEYNRLGFDAIKPMPSFDCVKSTFYNHKTIAVEKSAQYFDKESDNHCSKVKLEPIDEKDYLKKEEEVVEGEPFTIIFTSRGRDLLLYKGYRFTKTRVKKNGDIAWRCINRNDFCYAAVTTRGKWVIRENMHKCQANVAENEIKKKITECLRRIQSESTPFRQIYADAVNEYNKMGFDSIKPMPSFSSVKTRFYNYKNAAIKKTIEYFEGKAENDTNKEIVEPSSSKD